MNFSHILIKRILVLFLVFSCLKISGNIPQKNIGFAVDSLKQKDVVIEEKSFPIANYIIPATFISYGIATRFSTSLQDFDHTINEKIKSNVSRKYTFDDYLQYVTPVAMYTLNLCGVKSENNLRDQTIILANSALLAGITVVCVKNTTKVPRPDSGAKNSFPSGHTTTAFVGAHILFKEYKNTSPWIGVAGYLSAATVGTFRMINQRHWFSDVIMGAGIGIVCVEISYLMLPMYQRLFERNKINSNNGAMMISPIVGNDYYAVGLILVF
ncbi:phosphatase PAP2 family protein [Bacteroidales bacterium OttesenSCG-928-K03]|nr:phosphatase PAP2 family protein [Odoribacter sp. OttesenSCG-928-L07]MDL2238829.1 phosphatase PAP2 family protein [Bacteroidales bacterium OttesenSCG-928-L14]MDL2240238.1 phosphatase PAP2 family protein [Bacteroidales bacterium OttesenSCG-928-K22]MDL2242426.1 phosphatase PAP2 family protein [Bacteroidales bacterium OttesenSCG-928-K03]